MSVMIIWFLFLGLGLWLFVSLIYYVYKNWQLFVLSWKEMSPFGKRSFRFGLYLYISLPFLASHPHGEKFIGKLTLPPLEAAANAFFILGLIAFFRKFHKMDTSKE